MSDDGRMTVRDDAGDARHDARIGWDGAHHPVPHHPVPHHPGPQPFAPVPFVPRLFTPRDRTDHLFWLALVTLPVDGTVIGLYQPFWTPISPWLLLVYCLVNPRALRLALNRYAPFVLLPIALAALSAPGWAVFGVHPTAVVMSLSGVIAVPAAICALDIAFDVKRLDWSECVRTVLAAYWCAFGVGVVQWLAIRLDVGAVNGYFNALMARSYMTGGEWAGGGTGRPQFLFAEPSYIGMHLFGVLLPLCWLMRTRDTVFAKRLRHLIVAFAAGSVLMGSGVRIVLDSLVALVVVLVVRVRWSDGKARRKGIAWLGGIAALGVVGVVATGRLRAILLHGMTGDGSFFARIWQSLGPLCGLIRHPWTFLTGYGAGDLADAVHEGGDSAVRALAGMGVDASTNAAYWYAGVTPETVWTMCLYTNLVVEFGLIGLALLAGVTLRFVTRRRAWSKTTVCWLLLLAYLYVQFEGYAFIAFPLFVWAVDRIGRPTSYQTYQ